MKKYILPQLLFFCTILSSSCSNNSQQPLIDLQSKETDKSTIQKTLELSLEFLGNYHGIQPSYFMKNQYGDDMIINGNKVPIPSIDYKFLLKENNIVSLQQTNLEDDSRVYYDGTFKIINNTLEFIKVECILNNGESSNPTYILTINKSDKTAICNDQNDKEPEFKLVKK
jgi:hypothetical protein